MKRFVCLLVVLLMSTSWARQHSQPKVKFELNGPTGSFAPGPVTYQLVVYPSAQSGTLRINVSGDANAGQNLFEIKYENREPLTLDILVDVPANDTTHFSAGILEIAGTFRFGSAGAWFVADESTVTILDHDPGPGRDFYEMEALKRERDSARAVRDSIKAARKIGPPHPWDGWSGPLVTGRDSLGNETWDSIASERLKQGIEPKRQVTPPAPPLPRDSVEKLLEANKQAWLDEARQVQKARENQRHPERGGTPQEQMDRFIRQNPVSKAVEFVADGPTLWVRREGDSVFTVSTPIKDRKAYREERAKRSAEKQANKQYDIILDLSKPEDRAFVDELHLDLKATDRPNYYRTTVDRSTVMKLEAAKIRWTAYPLLPDGTFSPDYKERESKQQKDGNNSKSDKETEKDPSDIFYYNGFEQSNWYNGNLAYDDNDENGFDHWWRWGTTSTIGYDTFALWCAGYGGRTPTQGYDDNMLAYFDRELDVEFDEIYDIEYKLFFHTEQDFDWVTEYLYYSGDWHWVREFTGLSGIEMFNVQTVPPYDPDSLTWELEFYSNDTVSSGYLGAWVDNIYIFADHTESIDLTPDTPPNWDDAIVVSLNPGTHSSVDLITGQPAYIDIAVLNTGNVTVPGFCVDVYMGFELLGTLCRAANDSLAPGQYAMWEDTFYTAIVPPGEHYIRMEIDPGHFLWGEDFSDNIYDSWHFWKAPNLAPETWSGWPQPIVVSNGKNDHTLDLSLYTNDSIYIDACWSNEANLLPIDSPFTTRLSVDGNTVRLEETVGLGIFASDRIDSVIDIPLLVAPNWHVCSLFVDYGDDILESNENDNVLVHDFYVKFPQVTAEGYFSYRDRNFRFGQSGFYKPGYGFQVELWEYNAGSSDELLWVDNISDPYDGEFTLGPITNIEYGDQSRRDLYVKIKAANSAGWGFVDTNVTDTFTFVTDTVSEVDNGVEDFGNWIFSLSETDLFYALHMIDSARNSWISLTGLEPDAIGLTLSTIDESYYDPGTGTISLDSVASDEYERLTSFNATSICHEYGHYLQDEFDFLDETTPHYHNFTNSRCSTFVGDSVLLCPPDFVLTEAFAYFYALLVLDTSVIYDIMRDSAGNLSWRLNFDMDSGSCWLYLSDTVERSDTNFNSRGPNVEAAVCGLLLDILDTTKEDLPIANFFTSWPPTSGDGIGDTISVPMTDILSKFINEPNGYVQPTDIFEYYVAWLTDPYQGHPKALHDVYYEHGIDLRDNCCVGLTGNVNGDPDEIVNIIDLNQLVNILYVTFDFQSLACQGEANTTGDSLCAFTMTDIARLVNMLFVTFEPVATCLEFDAGLCNHKNSDFVIKSNECEPVTVKLPSKDQDN